MDYENKITEGLGLIGWRVADVAVNGAGRWVKLIEHQDGRTVAMFNPDVEDLIGGHASLEQIVERNVGADLADPWPVRERAN